ncbi:MAG: hypothetical protein MJ092_02215 [Lachnospiraceae bacterium]|nr:hypothetical protein [Lachnospiraceae bacterium]
MKTFPNAARGIKNVFKAEILELYSILAVVVGTIFVVCSITTGSLSGILILSLLGILISLGSLALYIVSFVKMLTGLKAAGVDEEVFKKALICVIVSLGVEVIAIILSSFVKSSVGNDIASVISRIADLGATFFILNGCSSLLQQRGETQLAANGKNTLNMILVLFGISIVFRIIPLFIISIVGDIIFLILFAIVSVIAYVKYLAFLKHAAGNLA